MISIMRKVFVFLFLCVPAAGFSQILDANGWSDVKVTTPNPGASYPLWLFTLKTLDGTSTLYARVEFPPDAERVARIDFYHDGGFEASMTQSTSHTDRFFFVYNDPGGDWRWSSNLEAGVAALTFVPTATVTHLHNTNQEYASNSTQQQASAFYERAIFLRWTTLKYEDGSPLKTWFDSGAAVTPGTMGIEDAFGNTFSTAHDPAWVVISNGSGGGGSGSIYDHNDPATDTADTPPSVPDEQSSALEGIDDAEWQPLVDQFSGLSDWINDLDPGAEIEHYTTTFDFDVMGQVYSFDFTTEPDVTTPWGLALENIRQLLRSIMKVLMLMSLATAVYNTAKLL